MQQARLRLTLLLSLVIVIVIVSYSVAGPVSASGWKYLTHDWTLGSVNLYSDLAKEIHEAQRRCEKKMWFAPPNAGMGSDIHVWSFALCNAMQRNTTMVQPGRTGGDWIWADAKFCKYTGSRVSNGRPFFDCYFNEGGMCNLTDVEEKFLVQTPETRSFSGTCRKYVTDVSSARRFTTAAMEYLFSRLSRELMAAADHAAGEVFHYKDVPRHKMISVHVRWGDKIREMQLVGVRTYMQALERLVAEQGIDTPFVYLTTETYEAYNEFKKVFSEEDKYANWTLLNHRHSLAGKGAYSGYKERNPMEFPNSSQIDSTNSSKKKRSRIRSSSNSSGVSNSSGIIGRHRKGGRRRGREGDKKQQLQQVEPLSGVPPPSRGSSSSSSVSNGGDSSERYLSSANLLPTTTTKKSKKRSFSSQPKKYPPRYKKQGGHAPNGGVSGGYKITSAVRAVSPMSLAKKGDQSLGRHSLIALLIAMEARHFVLTTGSNWSRLINELRLSVLEGRCLQEREGEANSRACTTMVDLMEEDDKDAADWWSDK